MYDIDSVQDITAAVQGDKIIFTPPTPGTWQVFVYYAGSGDIVCHNAAKDTVVNPAYVVSHFDKGIMHDQLDAQIGAGAWEPYYGNTLRGYFTDSFELTNPWLWGHGLLAEFQKRRGYDLTPYLMTTFTSGSGFLSTAPAIPSFSVTANGVDVGGRIRHDYQQTISDMFNDYFLGELKAWGDIRGLKSRVQCYGHPMDNLRAFGNTHIPETEQLADSGSIDFMKLVGSSALLYRQPQVTAESLVWMGNDYMCTPMKMKVASDRLFISGVNQMIYHGWPYRQADVDFPGYFPFHGMFGSFIAPENPLFPYFAHVNQYITRGQYLMQTGPAIIDVAVYNQNMHTSYNGAPHEELHAGVLEGFDRPAASAVPVLNNPPRTHWEAMSKYSLELSHVLMDAGYDYAHINMDRLLCATLENGRLQVGDAAFQVLLVPNAETLDIEAAHAMRRLMDAGFPVVFIDQVPGKVPGFADYKALEAALAQLLAGQKAVCRSKVSGTLKAIVPPGVSANAPDIQHMRRDFHGQTLYFIRSTSPTSRQVTLTLPIQQEGRLLNCWNGQCGSLPTQPKGAGCEITLPFGPYGSFFLLFGNNLPIATDEGYLPVLWSALSTGGTAITEWQLETDSMVPQDPRHVSLALHGLQDWADIPELQHFSGQATYTAHFSVADASTPHYLNLGLVSAAADVKINGTTLPPLVAAPFVMDISAHVQAGDNVLEITVTNALRNGLIGIKSFKPGFGPMAGEKPLAMSGLIGPVCVKTGK